MPHRNYADKSLEILKNTTDPTQLRPRRLRRLAPRLILPWRSKPTALRCGAPQKTLPRTTPSFAY